MKKYIKDGSKVNMLTVIKEIEPRVRTNGNPRRVLLCRCECGKEKEILFQSLTVGRTKSCGCHQKDVVRKGAFARTHGLSGHKIFTVWKRMIERCTSERHYSYKDYGGRGITVCKSWLKSPTAFYNWAVNNGYEVGLELDRRNNDGNYTPSNCRFVTHDVNLANRRPYKKRVVNN